MPNIVRLLIPLANLLLTGAISPLSAIASLQSCLIKWQSCTLKDLNIDKMIVIYS